MVLLMVRRFNCCQPLGNSDTRKLTESVTLAAMSSGFMPTLATATPMHSAFLLFKANFTDALVASTFSTMFSLAPRTVGNLPALFRPGPSKRGI